MLKPNCRGFTLLELMIAVAVIAILVAIGLPSYERYIQRGRLTDAFNTLSSFRMSMEQDYQDDANYGTNACEVATPAATAYFTYACTLTNAGQGFTATATGIGAMAGYAYSVDDSGNEQTTAYPGASGLPASCWWVQPGDC